MWAWTCASDNDGRVYLFAIGDLHLYQIGPKARISLCGCLEVERSLEAFVRPRHPHLGDNVLCQPVWCVKY